MKTIILILLCLSLFTGCDHKESSSLNATTVLFKDFNNETYIDTTEFVDSVGKMIKNNDLESKDEVFEIPGIDPKNEVAIKIHNKYIKLIKKPYWCSLPNVTKDNELFKKSGC